jgi:hypothetical protein
MPLTREEFEELTLALVIAFPRQGDLEIMVKFKLGVFLNTITSGAINGWSFVIDRVRWEARLTEGSI